MADKVILLTDIPQMMLIVEHASGVRYRNQVGGVVNAQEEVEGVLSPLDIEAEAAKRIESCPYPQGKGGISSAIANVIDASLASEPGTRFVKVDRARLEESWEAWVYVLLESAESVEANMFGPYFGAIYGFGKTRGVLTWSNSD